MAGARATVPLMTEFGVLELDATMVRILTVRSLKRPLEVEGTSVCVAVDFMMDLASGQYRMACCPGAVVWEADDPTRRAPDDVALALIRAIEKSLSDLLAADPSLATLAKAEIVQSKVREIETQIMITTTRLSLQEDERRRLQQSAADLRRSSLHVIPGGLLMDG